MSLDSALVLYMRQLQKDTQTGNSFPIIILSAQRLFFNHVVSDLHLVELLNEWCGHANSELSGKEFDIPFLFRIIEEHCQRNVAFVPL